MNATRRGSLVTLGVASLALAACVRTPAASDSGFALTPEQYAAWLDRYKQAWETRDPAAAGALFTEDASYHEMPFDAPMLGRAAVEAYWARVTAGQANVRFTYEVIACTGAEGVSHWHAAFTGIPGDAAIELDGVFVCRFADANHVSALREWWHVKVTPVG